MSSSFLRHLRSKARRLRHLIPTPIRRFRFSKTFVKNTVLILLALAMAGSLGVLAVFAYVSRDLPNPDSLTERSIPQSTKIYDRTGTHLLYEIHGEENRTLVKLQEGFCDPADSPMERQTDGVPLKLMQAVIAAEDHAFCSHIGFTFKGLARATLFGGSKGGGSTLTQQLVKNAILSNERSLVRKIKELILSIELERRYSKDEILQIYFNEIGYGSTYYGAESAAQNYFHTNVSKLSLAQIATLAALPQRPSTFLNNPDLLIGRRDWILEEMVDLKFITHAEAEAAKKEDTSISVNVSNIAAPHFVFHVKDILEQTYGQRQVEEGGLKVTTSLDFDKQKIAEEEVVAGVEARGESYKFTNAALVAIDPKTSQVLAMVGSKDFFDDTIDGQVNVTLRPRQPGSSFKPVVYAKAFANGYTPNTVLWDVPTVFPTASGPYAPSNYGGAKEILGPIRMREALQGSLNIPAVETLYLVGVGSALDFAESLGYTTFTDRSNFGLAIVLGGAEIKLLEHANAYGAFANEGTHRESVAILKVEDSTGKMLEEWKESEGTRVMDENIARMITNVLADNGARAYVFGSGSPLQLGGRPVAAKTGTTNDFHDAWTVGFTPSLVAGVWVGNNNNDEMKRGADGSIVAAPIWNAFMKRALEGTPIEAFAPPAIPLTGKPMLDGQIPSTKVTIDRVSGKLATEYTPPSTREERTYAEYHNILHYVDRSNPTGPAPTNPKVDPYYEPWEKGVQDWILKKEAETGIKITQEAIPTETDDVHVPQNFPTVGIQSPSDSTEYFSRDLVVEVEASAPRGIARVDYYIDGSFLGSSTYAPYQFSGTIPASVPRGYHTLKAVAYDDVENSGTDTVGIRVSTDALVTGFEIMDPKNGQTIERLESTYSVVVSLDRPMDYQGLTVYADPIGPGDTIAIGSTNAPTSPFLSFPWTLPESGDWVLSAAGTTQSGDRVETAGVLVHIITPSGTVIAPAPAPTPTDTTTTTPPPVTQPLNPFLVKP